MIINITVADCRAILEGTPTIVCDNKKKYFIKFAFDSEWGADTQKTARFAWVAGGKPQKADVIFTGDTVKVPALVDTTEVKVGVFEGDLTTTTPARIYCERSIRSYGGEPAEETPGQYDHIMTLYNQALEQQAAANSAANTARVSAQAAVAAQSKVEAIVAGNEAYTKNEADSRAAPAIVQSVSGAAVAVHDAADRPLQALVLHGGATQAGTPTPDAPLELVPAVNAGLVNVSLHGANLVKNLQTTVTRNGVTITAPGDGSLKIYGTSTDGFGVQVNAGLYLPDGVYFLSGAAAKLTLTVWGMVNGSWTSIAVDNGVGVSFKADASKYSHYLVQYSVQKGSTYNVTVYPMVNVGAEALPWEAYKEPQVLTIDLPVPLYAGSLDVLSGAMNYAGIVDLGAGDWGAGSGSSGWSHGYEIVGEETIALHHIGAEQADDYPTTLCSHFPVASSWGEIVGATTEMACRGNGNGRAYVAVRIKRSRLAEYGFIDDGTGETAPAAFQAWLEAQAAAGTPVQFVGEINNTAELGVKSAQSYKLTTTVTNDAGAAMSVDYVADTSAYIAANGGSRPVSSNSVLLKDHETGTVYELYVSGGKLRMAAVN